MARSFLRYQAGTRLRTVYTYAKLTERGKLMDYNQAALELHAKGPGKLTVQSLVPCKDKDALSTAYTPGVAEPCRKIVANPDAVYTYTLKGRTVAVVTNGTAVLGLG